MRLTEFTEAAQIKTDDNFRTYRALQSIEKNMNAQGLKGPQALEFLQTALLDTALNIVGREKRAGYEPHVVNVKNWADAKEFLMTAFRDAREQGVAEGYYDLNSDLPGMEPIDFSSNPSFKELITRYTQLVYQGHASETSPEEDQEHDAIEQYVAKRFGEKGSAHLQKAGEVSYWGRDDKPYGRDSRSSNLGRPNQPGGNFRTTKSGKMHGQDVKMMKNKVADRLGRHPEPALPESSENRSHFIRHNIWTVMDGDEEVMQHPVEGDPFFSAKKFIRDLDDQGYEFTHVISPEGEITYLPHLDPRNFPKDEVDEAGFGRATGRAAWDSNMPGYQGDYGGAENWGHRHREDDEHHEIDRRQEQQAASGTWYITIDGKLLKNKEGQPFTFVGKAAATKAAQTMMAKPFNQGKKFMLTTKGE